MSALVEFPPALYDGGAFQNFNPVPDFRLENALAMMWFAQLAYETGQPETISHVRELWNFRQITPMASHILFRPSKTSARTFSLDTRGVVGTKDDLLVIGFGGTDALVWENIWTDIDFVPDRGSDIHAGFQAAFDGIKSAFDKALELPHKHLFLTGHSLGAAIAALAAVSALSDGFPPTAVFTFGMPRVGGSTFAANYTATGLGAKTYRLVHGLDVVPRLPPAASDLLRGVALRSNFLHVGRMLHCESGTRFAAGELSGTDSNEPTMTTGLAMGVTSAIRNVVDGRILSTEGPGPLGPLFRLLPQPIRDHLQDRYIAALTPVGH